MFEYWSWWLSALSLAGLTIGYFLVLKVPLGVSGCWARVVMHKDSQSFEQDKSFRENPLMLKDSLMAATIEEFGRQAVIDFLAERRGKPAGYKQFDRKVSVASHVSWTVHMTFLLMLIIGGLIASILSGQFEFRSDLGSLHTSLFGSGVSYWITLIIGGVMVGFGTQMAGGCSSGHGLCGCSRFVPASLIATAVFFGTGIVVSMLLHMLAAG
ncbi:MAG: YeeE/YedE family protein [Gammaproteobacteria bacterium]|nr:YeeE/YedE family protein [Gammaproteobacteria bacterium]